MAKERKIDRVILGLLSHEPLTGYDIKKRIDTSIRFFWKGSFGSIYPALSDMEKNGLITRSEHKEEENNRERIEYSITQMGREFLVDWIKTTQATNELKYETLLKLFFGGVADHRISLRNIESFEANVRSELEILKGYKENLSKCLEDKDHVYFYLTVAFGVETYEGYLRWCQMAKETLEKIED